VLLLAVTLVGDYTRVSGGYTSWRGGGGGESDRLKGGVHWSWRWRWGTLAREGGGYISLGFWGYTLSGRCKPPADSAARSLLTALHARFQGLVFRDEAGKGERVDAADRKQGKGGSWVNRKQKRDKEVGRENAR
jgi:hypothetical protein